VTPPLFLLADIPSGDELYLAGDEGHHAARVKRVAVGERVLVANGLGTLLRCVVRAVTVDGVRLAVESRELVPAPQPRIVVVQALPKGDRAELAVEVVTELGIDGVVPWAASRSITQWHGARGEKALERWRRTAREASKQSRRPRFPQVAEPASTSDVARMLRDAATALVLHEGATESLAASPLPLVGDVLLVVGPEGGIAPDELDAFTAAGAHVVHLGSGVLRTSTAGAAALAALSVRLGRWG
jgi:16S rRNA (uracil1498-N3)-methyltransferase